MASLHRLHIESEQLQQQEEQTPKFQDYQPVEQTSALEEVYYFARLFTFCIISVAISFLLLALNWSPLLALPFACLLSFALTSLGKHIHILSKNRRH